MASTYFELTDGAVLVGITITEVDGALRFDLNVLDDTGTIGDLNGLFFDVSDGAILDGLSFEGTDLTGTVVKEDSVTKVDSYNNVNGEVVKEYDKFDVGVQFGTQGMAQDDIQSTSFTLSSDSGDLTIDSFLSQDFAVRLTSVGEIDGSRDGSVKIGGTAPDEPLPEDPDPVNVAVNDTLTVDEDEGFEFFGGTDTLDDGSDSLLDNDLTDADPYAGVVTAVNDTPLDGSVTVAGSNGGLLKVNADGSFDFSAEDDFEFLATGETATTQFTYEIEGGSTALVDVIVNGYSAPTGGPDDEAYPDDTPPPPGDDDYVDVIDPLPPLDGGIYIEDGLI